MADSVDRVFVHALNTVKKLPRGTHRPPPADRLRLYGLYKQSMEGDNGGAMARPSGHSERDKADLEKWEAWESQRGLSRTQAKRQYISLLIDTMHNYASSTADGRELVSELEFVWDQIKSNSPSASSSHSYPLHAPPPNPEQPPYTVSSKDAGARTVSRPGALRLVGPISEGQADEGADAPVVDAGEVTADEEEYVDAQDSQMADDVRSPSSTSQSGDAGVSAPKPAGGMGGPLINTISKYMRSGGGGKKDKAPAADDAKVRWHRRIEAALIKMNAEMAALREQIEMQQEAATAAGSSILPSFHRQRKKVGLVRSVLDSAVAVLVVVVRHLVIDLGIVALLALYMHYRGIPAERLEEGVMDAMRRLRRLALWNRLSKSAARVELPISMPKPLNMVAQRGSVER